MERSFQKTRERTTVSSTANAKTGEGKVLDGVVGAEKQGYISTNDAVVKTMTRHTRSKEAEGRDTK